MTESTNNHILVTVIIPAHNAAGTIKHSLDSVLEQSFKNYEVIIVDDASSDNTVDVIEAWLSNQASNFKVIRLSSNTGPAGARNAGVQEAQGELVAFLDADDAWLPNTLECQMELITNHDDVDMVCGNTVSFDTVNDACDQSMSNDRDVVALKLNDFSISNPVATSTVLVKKLAVNDVGGFDESFRGPEDYDLWMRIAAKYSIVKTNQILARYRTRSLSLSMDDRKFLPEMIRVINKAYAPGGVFHGSPGKRRALGYQHLSASWMATDRYEICRGVKLFLKSLFLWPFAFRGIRDLRLVRTKRMYLFWKKTNEKLSKNVSSFWGLVREFLSMPEVTINLMLDKTKSNHSFFEEVTKDFYNDTLKRHKKMLFLRNMRYGIAVCHLPDNYDEYFMLIEAAARRNQKKATRLGYSFERIDFNAHLSDIEAIRKSTNVRQGVLKADFVEAKLKPCLNPESKTNIHDYPYFGVLKDGKLYAYSGCFVAGELCAIEQLLGHADYQKDGVVPMLVTGMADYVLLHYPDVKYYMYGTYFGASETMRRFKRKFKFLPHRVDWILE